jgi:uncharacterized Fe-S radical SAM superfamily protein PflX
MVLFSCCSQTCHVNRPEYSPCHCKVNISQYAAFYWLKYHREMVCMLDSHKIQGQKENFPLAFHSYNYVTLRAGLTLVRELR